MKRSLIFFVGSLLFYGFLQQKDSFVQMRYEDIDDYMKARNRLMQAELAMRFDAGSTLSSEEKEAN